MTKTFPTVARIRKLFSFDKETGSLIYLVAPFRKPHFLGKRAGRMDKRDMVEYISIDCETYLLRHIVSLHQTGKVAEDPSHHTQLTHERLLALLRYDDVGGTFTRVGRKRGVKVGARADYTEHNGYRYVNVDGNRYLASRLAWFYIHGEWPKRVLRFQDGDEQNCAISNLAYGEWDLSDPVQKRAYDKKNRKAKPMSYRKSQLKRDFGISLEQYQAAFVAQEGVCACCLKPETSERGGKRKWLAVDHDHLDGTFRGLLCSSCNQGLGRFGDDVEVLRRAAAYLESHAAKPKTNVISLAGRLIAKTGD